MMADLPFGHQSSSVHIEIIGVLYEEVSFFLNSDLSFLQEVDVSGLRALLVQSASFASSHHQQEFHYSHQ